MIVGCYSLNLYCKYSPVSDPESQGLELRHDYHNRGEGEFTGYDRATVYAQARRAGWVFTKDKDVLCPQCAKNR